jgi:hypothetical protein
MSRRTEYAFVYTSCIHFAIWYGSCGGVLLPDLPWCSEIVKPRWWPKQRLGKKAV